VRASLERVAPLLAVQRPAVALAKSLDRALRVEQLRVASLRGRRPRLEVDFVLGAGERLLVLGRAGDGKSTLLRCLAGLESPTEGKLLWDDQLVTSASSLADGVAYLPQNAVFAPARVWRIFGIKGPDALEPQQLELLRRASAWSVVRRFKKELGQKVGSATLSPNEARALTLGAVLLSRAPLLVLDSPLAGLGVNHAAERLQALLAAASGRTLVIGLTQLSDVDSFDHVLSLRRGRIAFYGTPSEWKAWKAAKKRPEVFACKA
jgi:ABC-type transport system involved in cytochrome bd biosynthesis fused ATPase/permease subunit